MVCAVLRGRGGCGHSGRKGLEFLPREGKLSQERQQYRSAKSREISETEPQQIKETYFS